MRELSETELLNELTQKAQTDAGLAVFVYSPFCGTCKLADRMMAVVEAHDPSISLVKADIQYMPKLRERWRVSSVPALVYVKRGRIPDRLYAFQSVMRIHEWLTERGEST